MIHLIYVAKQNLEYQLVKYKAKVHSLAPFDSPCVSLRIKTHIACSYNPTRK